MGGRDNDPSTHPQQGYLEAALLTLQEYVKTPLKTTRRKPRGIQR